MRIGDALLERASVEIYCERPWRGAHTAQAAAWFGQQPNARGWLFVRQNSANKPIYMWLEQEQRG
jgi:hypothetical protein